MDNNFQNQIYKIVLHISKTISAEEAWKIAAAIDLVAKPKSRKEIHETIKQK